MSSKAAKRKKEFEQRKARRQQEVGRRKAIRNSKNLADLAKAMGIKLK